MVMAEILEAFYVFYFPLSSACYLKLLTDAYMLNCFILCYEYVQSDAKCKARTKTYFLIRAIQYYLYLFLIQMSFMVRRELFLIFERLEIS